MYFDALNIDPPPCQDSISFVEWRGRSRAFSSQPPLGLRLVCGFEGSVTPSQVLRVRNRTEGKMYDTEEPCLI